MEEIKKIEPLNLKAIQQRDFNADEIVQTFKRNMVVWNWGAHDFVKDKDEFGDTLLMFKVNGAKFKGSVCITLNYNDSFHIYFVDKRCMLKGEEPEVYVETLLNTIDKFVETN